MRSMVAALIFLLMIGGSARAGQVQRNERCLVEVLYSDELPIGPLFHHTVRATLLVTAPHERPTETTVYKVIPWQVPAPRRGQKLWMRCNLIALHPLLGFF